MSQTQFLILIGVPGAGKSTWANKTLSHTCMIVSPDDIRAEFGDVMDQSKNREVWDEAYRRVTDYLVSGKDVILDATHATARTRNKSIEVGKAAGAEIFGIYFPISAVEAKIRNLGRERIVPEHVIDRMTVSLMKEPPSRDEGFDHFALISEDV